MEVVVMIEVVAMAELQGLWLLEVRHRNLASLILDCWN